MSSSPVDAENAGSAASTDRHSDASPVLDSAEALRETMQSVPPPSIAPSRPSSLALRLVGGSAAALLFIGVACAVWGWPRQAMVIAAATGGAVGAAVAIGLAATSYLGRPIRQLTRSVVAMAAGNRDARAVVRGDDELTNLARALNQFATEHLRSLDALRAERDLLASILDGMGEGVLVLDADEQIVLVNRALRGLARLNEDAVGKPLIEAIRNAPLKEALDAVRVKDEAVVREIELGRPLPRKLLVRVSRLPQGSSQRGTIAVFHDVTDLRRLETIRTDFVANVSHELRTPVTAISTATETLLAGALQDPLDAASFVDVIDRNAQRLRQLVDDLLDLAKIEAKSFRMVLAEVEVRPILIHVVDLMIEQARKKKMTIRRAPGTDGVRARCDKRSLEQAVMNLVDNAIKYAGGGRRGCPLCPGGGRPDRGGGIRQRRRYLPDTPRPTLRAVLPCRRGSLSRGRRNRPRIVHRQALGRAHGRPDHRRERARQGRAVHHPAPSAGGGPKAVIARGYTVEHWPRASVDSGTAFTEPFFVRHSAWRRVGPSDQARNLPRATSDSFPTRPSRRMAASRRSASPRDPTSST